MKRLETLLYAAEIIGAIAFPALITLGVIALFAHAANGGSY
jgi:hypothetical protein